jgi:hypothetical protein
MAETDQQGNERQRESQAGCQNSFHHAICLALLVLQGANKRIGLSDGLFQILDERCHIGIKRRQAETIGVAMITIREPKKKACDLPVSSEGLLSTP